MIDFQTCISAFREAGMIPTRKGYQLMDGNRWCGCVAGALGAARGIFLADDSLDFLRRVAESYRVSDDFLEGLENGFMGWEPTLNADAYRGYAIGHAVRFRLMPDGYRISPDGILEVAGR